MELMGRFLNLNNNHHETSEEGQGCAACRLDCKAEGQVRALLSVPYLVRACCDLSSDSSTGSDECCNNNRLIGDQP